MAFLFADSFDLYSSVSDAQLRWTVANSQSTLIPASSTALGVGQALQFPQVATTTTALSATFATNETTIFASFRLRYATGAAGGYGGSLSFLDGTTAQVSLSWLNDGSFEVRSGAAELGTLLATVGRMHQIGIWDSYQVKVVIDSATGSVEIRKNGSTTPVLSISNVNTRGGTTNSYANKASFICHVNSSANAQIDDVWFNSGSGAAPNDWPGDVRSYQQTPASDVQAQFSASPAVVTLGNSSGTSNSTGLTANSLQASLYTAGITGTVPSLTFGINSTTTGHIQAAIYDATGPAGTLGNLLGTTTVVTNPVVGANTATFGTPVAVTRNSQYWLAYLSDATYTPSANAGGSGETRVTLTSNYSSGFPASLASTGQTYSTGNQPRVIFGAITTVGNWSSVADLTQDGDSSYVASSTVGNEDIYNLSALSNLTGITGVNYYAIWKKTDAGARSGGLQLIANGSADTNIANVSLSPSYTLTSSFQALDPTSASWTQTTINSAQIGVKVTA